MTQREDEHYYNMITVSPPAPDLGMAPLSATSDGSFPSEFAMPKHQPHIYSEDSPNMRQYHQNNSARPNYQSSSDMTSYNSTPQTQFANPVPQIQTTGFLSPPSFSGAKQSPTSDVASNHSLYSSVSSNAHSSFQDALSHFSEVPTDEKFSGSFFETQNKPHNIYNDDEIVLGGSVSYTDLSGQNYGEVSRTEYSQGLNTHDSLNIQVMQGLHQQFQEALHQNPANQEQFQVPQFKVQEPLTYGQDVPTYQANFDKLTENNLSSYNDNLQHDVTISVEQAPEIVGARTPSLFSNSSRNSSAHNTPANFGNSLQPPGQISGSASPVPSYGGNSPSLGPSSPYEPSDSGSNMHLRPEEFASIRRGRQSAHSYKSSSRHSSRSRSRSGSVSNASSGEESEDEDSPRKPGRSKASSREKMLELASPATNYKRTQKNPSIFACHLCDKRFTRPYNLKSHLRTHTDERPFICTVCGKAFARQHDRKRHEELHSGEKKFQCKGVLKDGTPFGCGRKFARADALRRHFQTESGKECIRLLVEEDARENESGVLTSGIQLPSGDFMNPILHDEVPSVEVLPPE